MRRRSGFTLIETIAALVLGGMLMAVAGLGLSQVAQGYLIARDNSEISEKGQVVMARLIKELTAANTFTISGGNTLNYTSYKPGQTTAQAHVLNQGSGGLQLDGRSLVGASGDAVQVSGFTLTSSGSGPGAIIVISLSLQGSSGQVATFTNRVTPRNL